MPPCLMQALTYHSNSQGEDLASTNSQGQGRLLSLRFACHGLLVYLE